MVQLKSKQIWYRFTAISLSRILSKIDFHVKVWKFSSLLGNFILKEIFVLTFVINACRKCQSKYWSLLLPLNCCFKIIFILLSIVILKKILKGYKGYKGYTVWESNSCWLWCIAMVVSVFDQSVLSENDLKYALIYNLQIILTLVIKIYYISLFEYIVMKFNLNY